MIEGIEADYAQRKRDTADRKSGGKKSKTMALFCATGEVERVLAGKGLSTIRIRAGVLISSQRAVDEVGIGGNVGSLRD